MDSRITITLVLNGEEHDFSFPADTRIRDIQEKLESQIPAVFRGASAGNGVLYLRNRDGYFDEEHSFRDYGVMDGARVEISYL